MKLIDVLLICERIQKIANKEKAPFNEAIVSMAKKLGKKIAEYSLTIDGKIYPITYARVSNGFNANGSKFGTKYWWPNLDEVCQDTNPKHAPGPGIDCSSFVTWVLLECGYIKRLWQFGSSFFDRNKNGGCEAIKGFKNEYTLVPIKQLSDVQAGDIMKGNGHIGFAAQNGSIKKQYGMGGENGILAFKGNGTGITNWSTKDPVQYVWRVIRK